MAKEDEMRTTFITSQGIFCYSKMPFRLKNAGATYQHLVDKAFQKQIGKNLEGNKHEAKSQEMHIRDRRRHVPGIHGKHQRDKVCPDKVEAVLSLHSPKCLKDEQRLNGKLASLNIFLSKSAEFFKTLKKCMKKSDFQWTAKAPRISVKGQILADFIVKQLKDDSLAASMEIKEIPYVLWAHRTMIKSSNKDTPFSLTYETEAVIPAEIGMPTLQTTEIDMVQNDKDQKLNLDLLEEKREQAAIHEARSKAKMEKFCNFKVCNTSFKPIYLVYRSNDANYAEDEGKLGPKWEGPYEVMEALGKGAYKLRDRNGKLLPQTWNVCNLKKCYGHEM
uniref:Reverse transcriptase domain-containing protein n=1 Tax=Tanacetum cinerariifolium TaxID=118510 RepID=A0A6L2L6X2_TANCI|nr:reverse transcriptase domain-containing protein [Tanacetum cinerariifolium]